MLELTQTTARRAVAAMDTAMSISATWAIYSAAFSAADLAGGRTSNPNAPRRGGDVSASVTISFEEAAKGCVKR